MKKYLKSFWYSAGSRETLEEEIFELFSQEGILGLADKLTYIDNLFSKKN